MRRPGFGHTRLKRTIVCIALLALLVPLFAAFEAHVINVRAHIENALHVDPAEIDFGTVFPQERLSEEFTIRLSDSFMAQDRVTDAFYRLVLDRKPKVPGGEELYADLRPYVTVDKAEEADADMLVFADLGNDWLTDPDDSGSGLFRDTEDRWVIDLYVPCIVGAVGQDYEGPVAPAEDDYGMDIRVEVLGFSYGRTLHKVCSGPRQVVTGTRTEWTFYFVIKNDSGSAMHDIVLTDRFGAELEATDLYDVSFVYGSPDWTFEQFTSPSGRQDRIRWSIDELSPTDRGVLILNVATKLNPAGKQEYTTPGTYLLNSGAVLKWRDDDGVQHSESTPPLEIEAVAP